MIKPTSASGTMARRRSGPLPCGANVILCADDFAISDGVSRAIEELGAVRRLSATSAIVTLPTWTSHAPRLAKLRPKMAIGLHINLTLGQPMAAMPRIAPDGRLPGLTTLLAMALAGRLSQDEVVAEVLRQLTAFEAGVGWPPDFVDGHQHAHALPGIRSGVVRALARHDRERRLLVRDPADRLGVIVRRGASVPKALALSALVAGFGSTVRRAGFGTNQGFSGVSDFDRRSPYEQELTRFFQLPGRRHLVMCHPGYPDAGLHAVDPIVERRQDELAAISQAPGLVDAIWHVERGATGKQLAWPGRRCQP